MRRALLCSLLVLVLIPGLSLAQGFSFTHLGNFPGPLPAPNLANESAAFNIVGPTFDCFVIGSTAGPLFQAPNVLTAMDAGWTQLWGTPASAAAGGPATSSLGLTINFAGPIVEGTRWDFAGYAGNNYLGSLGVEFANGIWQDRPSGFDPGKNPPVPEPATWLTLLAGIGVLGVLRYRA